MPNTTNNNWPTPADTDLVKNGADAIRDLGNAIDTTLGVYSPATPMGVHLSTVTFSGVASVSVNDVFTSTYNAYRVIFNLTSVANNDSNVVWRFRKAGSDNALNYYYQWAGSSNAAAFFPSASNQTSAIVNIMDVSSIGNFYGTSLDIFGPQTNTKTVVTGTMMGLTQASAPMGAGGGFWHDQTDQFDGFSIILNGAGTPQMTGTVRTYGYNQ